MPIGREKRFGRLTGSNIDRFATSNGLNAETCRELMDQLARTVRDSVTSVIQANLHIPGVNRMGPALERTVRANCDAMLRNMDADGQTIDTSLFTLIDSGDIERS